MTSLTLGIGRCSFCLTFSTIITTQDSRMQNREPESRCWLVCVPSLSEVDRDSDLAQQSIGATNHFLPLFLFIKFLYRIKMLRQNEGLHGQETGSTVCSNIFSCRNMMSSCSLSKTYIANYPSCSWVMTIHTYVKFWFMMGECRWKQTYGGFRHLQRLDGNIGQHIFNSTCMIAKNC